MPGLLGLPDGRELMASVEELRRRAEAIVGVPRPLHDYQWEGVAFLYKSPCALLADEMGLGKTVQASVALGLALEGRKELGRALIVAPASLTRNWMSELAAWVPSLTVRRVQGDARDRQALYLLPIPILVCSYEQIRQDALDVIPADSFDIVVLDEAQRIKNRHSTTALACRLLPRKWAWALSATPLENETEDIESILEFLDPAVGRRWSGGGLSARLRKVMLRRRKAEVRRELPPVLVQDLELELTPAQRSRYDQLWDERSKVGSATAQKAALVLLGLITRLKVVCNVDVEAEASSKLDGLRAICDGAGQAARILVFSQFVRTLEWVSPRIPLASDMLTGSMSDEERQAAMKRFGRGPTPRILFVSLRAGGVGLNLGEATHVVVFDRWWNPAVENQAIYRAHRFSRDEPLHVVRLMVVDTIEERIAAILDRKERLFGDVVDTQGSRPGGGVTVREMRQMLELSGGEVPTIEREVEGA